MLHQEYNWLAACFTECVLRVYSDFFDELGAKVFPSKCSSIVRYETSSWFLDVLYLPEDGPRYCPRIEIGTKSGKFLDPRRNRIDVRHTVPPTELEHRYNLLWRFETALELEATLIAVRDRILKPYTIVILEDVARLQDLICVRCNVLDLEWLSEIANHNDSIFRQKAEEAFRAGEYKIACQCYAHIPIERRSKIDLAKLDFAQSVINRPEIG